MSNERLSGADLYIYIHFCKVFEMPIKQVSYLIMVRVVGRIHRLLPMGNHAERVAAGTPVNLAAAMEYLSGC